MAMNFASASAAAIMSSAPDVLGTANRDSLLRGHSELEYADLLVAAMRSFSGSEKNPCWTVWSRGSSG